MLLAANTAVFLLCILVAAQLPVGSEQELGSEAHPVAIGDNPAGNWTLLTVTFGKRTLGDTVAGLVGHSSTHVDVRTDDGTDDTHDDAFNSSMHAAWAAARSAAHLPVEVDSVLYVAEDNGPFRAGDLILDLPAANTTTTFELTIRRFGTDYTLTTTDQELNTLLIRERFTATPAPPATNTTDNLVGESGGLILALAYYDHLTGGQLSTGLDIAATGTIDEHGNVGPVIGVRSKLAAATAANVDVIFVPTGSDLGTHTNNTPIVEVRALADAINWLCGTTGNPDTRSCPTSGTATIN
jgi:PDZ domain-containing secreted protein